MTSMAKKRSAGDRGGLAPGFGALAPKTVIGDGWVMVGFAIRLPCRRLVGCGMKGFKACVRMGRKFRMRIVNFS